MDRKLPVMELDEFIAFCKEEIAWQIEACTKTAVPLDEIVVAISDVTDRKRPMALLVVPTRNSEWYLCHVNKKHTELEILEVRKDEVTAIDAGCIEEWREDRK